MQTMVQELSRQHKVELREQEARRVMAEQGHPSLSIEECEARLITYYIFIEDLHEQYDLDPEYLYYFDHARGLIFREDD